MFPGVQRVCLSERDGERENILLVLVLSDLCKRDFIYAAFKKYFVKLYILWEMGMLL